MSWFKMTPGASYSVNSTFLTPEQPIVDSDRENRSRSPHREAGCFKLTPEAGHFVNSTIMTGEQPIVDSDRENRSHSPHREATCKNIARPLQLVLLNRMGKLEDFCGKFEQKLGRVVYQMASLETGHVRRTEGAEDFDDRLNDQQQQIDQLRASLTAMTSRIDNLLEENAELKVQLRQSLEGSTLEG